MKRVMIILGVVLQLQYSSYASMTNEEVLKQLEAAQQSIDRVQCKMTVNHQSCGRSVIGDDGRKIYELTADSSQWIPPVIHTFQGIFSEDKYNITEIKQDTSGTKTFLDVWDGSQYFQYTVGSDWALLYEKPQDLAGAFIFDPRCLAYRRSPMRSLIDELREGQAKGVLTVRDAALKGVPVIYVECIYPKGQINDIGYKLWIDPARGFMPIQIQVNFGPFLGDQYMDIELREIEPGIWMPIKGTVYNHQVYNKADRTIVNVIQKIEVDVDSIKLNPAVSDTTFGISLPAGTEVHDRRTKPETVYRVARAPEVESDIFVEADVAQAEMTNASVATVNNPSDTTRHFVFGRKALAVYGSLMLFGFVMSWLLTRSRRA